MKSPKSIGYHKVAGFFRDWIICILLKLGWATPYYDRGYGGHGDILEEWGVEIRRRRIKQGGYTPLCWQGRGGQRRIEPALSSM